MYAVRQYRYFLQCESSSVYFLKLDEVPFEVNSRTVQSVCTRLLYLYQRIFIDTHTV